jgi:hypothetical protein
VEYTATRNANIQNPVYDSSMQILELRLAKIGFAYWEVT